MAIAAPLLLATAAVGIGASIYGGMQQKKAYSAQADMTLEQGRLQQEESLRAANAKAVEVRKFAAKQKLAYIANGVTLQGSPLEVIDETITQGQEEVDAIVAHGNAVNRLAVKQADIYKNQGRSALIGGIGSAAELGLSAYSTFGTGSKTEKKK